MTRSLRRSLMQPIPEIFEAARLLSSGVDAHLAGDRKTADRCFAEANSPVVWQYTDAGWGAGCRVRHGFISIPDGPPYLAKDARPVPRMPKTATKKAVVERDGYHCRFCGIPVVDPAIRTLLNREYPDTVTWTNRNAGQHAAFQCMWLQYDHVLPNSRGGESSLENVVVTCAPCNFGRMETTLAEAYLLNPLSLPLEPRWDGFAAWDGLERLRQIRI